MTDAERANTLSGSVAGALTSYRGFHDAEFGSVTIPR